MLMISTNTNNRRGQAIIGEFGLVVMLVLATIVAVTVYFKRSVQARIFDARNFMVQDVHDRLDGIYDGQPVYREYEPYYLNTNSQVTRGIGDRVNLMPGASSGIFQKTYNESTGVGTYSVTAPPQDFNLTTP